MPAAGRRRQPAPRVGATGASNRDELAMLPKYGTQRVADLAESRPRLDRVDDRRHKVALAARDLPKSPQRRLEGRPVAGLTDVLYPRDLVALPLRVDLLQIGRMDLAIDELVDADHDLLACLNASLRVVRR